MLGMIPVFTIYWSFLNRPASLSSTTTGIEVLPNLLRDTAFLTSVFSLIYVIITPVASNLLSKKYTALPKRKKDELPSYVLCLIHHIVAVPVAWSNVYADFNLTNEAAQNIDYAPLTAIIAPWCIAYLITDTMFFALPEAFVGKFEYITHHILTLILVISSLFGPGSTLRFIPHLLISDTTNIFFNTAWLIRAMGGQGFFFLNFLEISFAVSFFFVRVINMSAMFWALGKQATGLGLARYVLAPIALMQWFWFYKIVRIMYFRLVSHEPSNAIGSVRRKEKS